MRGRIVVKLGGSHAFAATLGDWLSAIEHGAGRTVLVAGGGPFADTVRVAQRRMGFDDRAADEMALLAMEQYALAIAALGRSFVVVDSQAGIDAALGESLVPVWAPRRMVRDAEGVPASWDVTSDSLAAWLAGRIGARHLILIKRVESNGARDPIDIEDLTARGIVDPAFPGFLAASAASGFLLGPDEQELLVATLRTGAPTGRAIRLGGDRRERGMPSRTAELR